MLPPFCIPHSGRRELTSAHCPLTLTHTYSLAYTHMCRHTHNKCNFKVWRSLVKCESEELGQWHTSVLPSTLTTVQNSRDPDSIKINIGRKPVGRERPKSFPEPTKLRGVAQHFGAAHWPILSCMFPFLITWNSLAIWKILFPGTQEPEDLSQCLWMPILICSVDEPSNWRPICATQQCPIWGAEEQEEEGGRGSGDRWGKAKRRGGVEWLLAVNLTPSGIN